MPSVDPPIRRWWALVLWSLAGIVTAAYLVWTVPGVRPRPGFSVAYDAVLQGAGYTLVAVLAVLGAMLRKPSRATWWLVASAVVLRAVGFDISLTILAQGRPLPYPSVADLAWGLSVLALVAAVGFRIHELAPRLAALTVLDGIAGSLVVLGGAVGVLAGPVGTLARGAADTAAITVNVGYPVLDTALLVAGATLVLVVRMDLQRADLELLLGILAFVVVDVVFFVLLAEGSWRPGTLLASFSLVATALIAMSVWISPTTRVVRAGRFGDTLAPTPAPGIVMPAALATLAVLGLAWVGLQMTSPLRQLPFVVAALVAIGRTVLTVRRDRVESGEMLDVAELEIRRFHALVEASTDFIGIADAEGRVLYINPAGRRMVGVGPDSDLTHLTVAEILAGDGAGAFEARWAGLLETGSWRGDSVIAPLDASGPPIPVAASTFVVRETGTEPPFVVATIQRDISAQREAESAMLELADQRARLMNRLVQAQEDERSRIAADVHDDSVQVMAAVDLRLGLLRRRLEEKAPDSLETLDALHDTVVAATDRLRNLLFDLESPARRTQLAEALAEAAENVFHGTDVRWELIGDTSLDLPEAERVTAYRIAKEALVNVRKHAGARYVEIELGAAADGVALAIRDDGRGIEDDAARGRPGHLGLSSISDRAAMVGGRVEVRRRDEGGTEVLVVLPVPEPAR